MTSCWSAIASRPLPAQMLAYVQHAVAELKELARYSSSNELKVDGKKGTSSDIITRMRNGDTAAMEKARQSMGVPCGITQPGSLRMDPPATCRCARRSELRSMRWWRPTGSRTSS